MPTKMHPCILCGALVRVKYLRCDACREAGHEAPRDVEIVDAVEHDRTQRKAQRAFSVLQEKYRQALGRIESLETALHVSQTLKQSVDPVAILPQHGHGTSEATAVWVASDWHVEEVVGPELGILNNRFNPEIAAQRASRFFQAGLRLTQLLNKDVKIQTVVLALLGDFLSGDIHEEVAETCAMPPMEAAIFAQNQLISGIEFLLAHSKYRFVLVCHSGNHARTTKTTHFSRENGHSLEYLLYLHLQTYFRREPRITFVIPEGPHSYLPVYDQTIRFQHGHMIKYHGGVGGIYIPTNKAIANWNMAHQADLDVFGHFHQQVDGGRFICNGSLIGYNGFALSIKAPYEDPKQTLFLLDKKRGRTCLWPIILEDR